MHSFIKKTLVVLVSVAFVSGTLFLDYKFKPAKSNWDEVSVQSKGADAIVNQNGRIYELDSGKTEDLKIVIGENSVARFAANTSAVLTLPLNENDKLRIQLKKGRLWLNTLNASLRSEIATVSVNIKAEPGVFDIKYEGASVVLKALRHSLQVAFSGKSLILPEARQMNISELKIRNATDTITKLRYSKLTKEFPYFSAERNDEWANKNLREDDEFASEYRRAVAAKIRQRGVRIPLNDSAVSFRLGGLLSDAKIALTFDSAKRQEREIQSVLDYFDSAVYANLIGRYDVAERRLNDFVAFVRNMLDAGLPAAEWRDALVSRIAMFAFAQPDEQDFSAKTTLREVVQAAPIAYMHGLFNDILDTAYDAASVESQQKVLTLLRRFGSQADSKIGNANLAQFKEDIFFESVLLNDFLNRNPKFLREEFLRISEIFERAYLNSIVDKEEQEDQRQFFISEKLKRIKAIIAFLNSNTMAFQDARGSILLLVRQIEALKPAFTANAVISYFEGQLSQMGSLLSFLRSSTADEVRGSFQESFDEFQSSMDELRRINEMLANASGGAQISPFRREELAGIVLNDASAVGLRGIRIVLPDEEGDARVRIESAQFEGKTFQGLYDTAGKVWSEMVFDGERISNAIRLENLNRFLLVKLGRVVLPSGVSAESLTEAPSQQSIIERVAKATLMEELQKNNIVVEERYLGFENLSEGIIHVRLAHIGEGANRKVFSFDIEQRSNIVRNLRVQTVSGEIPVNDSFALRELPIKVEQIYQRALFEKQREEELARFAREGAGSTTR